MITIVSYEMQKNITLKYISSLTILIKYEKKRNRDIFELHFPKEINLLHILKTKKNVFNF